MSDYNKIFERVNFLMIFMRNIIISLTLMSASLPLFADNVYRFKLPKDILNSGLPKDCSTLLAENPSHKSGYVTIFPNGLRGPAIEVFCDMETTGGGWTRILSVGVGKTKCFGNFTLNSQGYCVKSANTVGFFVETMGLDYTEIRGSVSAYQSGSSDGFRRYGGATSHIDDNYVDGLSFTYFDDTNQRHHIFTYAIGQSQAGNRQSCPDIGGDAPPAYVEDDYYCESGNAESGYTFDFYEQELFGGFEFYKNLNGIGSRNLEVRVMNDQHTGDENIGLNSIYIYIR